MVVYVGYASVRKPFCNYLIKYIMYSWNTYVFMEYMHNIKQINKIV